MVRSTLSWQPISLTSAVAAALQGDAVKGRLPKRNRPASARRPSISVDTWMILIPFSHP
jgi:hypothetical protein